MFVKKMLNILIIFELGLSIIPESEITRSFTLKLRTKEENSYLNLQPDYLTQKQYFVFSKKMILKAQTIRSLSDTQCIIKIYQEGPGNKKQFMKAEYLVDNNFLKEPVFFGTRFFDSKTNSYENYNYYIFTSTFEESVATEFFIENEMSSPSLLENIHKTVIWMTDISNNKRIYLKPKFNKQMDREKIRKFEVFKQNLKKIKVCANFELTFPVLLRTGREFGGKESEKFTFQISVDLCPKLERYFLEQLKDQLFCEANFAEDVSGALLPSGIQVPFETKKKNWFCGKNEIVLGINKKGVFG